MRQSEIDFGGIVGISGVLLEVEIAKQNEIIQLARIRTIESVRFFDFCGWVFITFAKLFSHEGDCLSQIQSGSFRDNGLLTDDGGWIGRLTFHIWLSG